MRRVRKFIVPAVVLLLMTFIGAKLLLSPVYVVSLIPSSQLPSRDEGGLVYPTYPYETHRGWPWVYARSEVSTPSDSSPSPLDILGTHHEFSWRLLLADFVVLVSLGSSVGWALHRHYRRRGRWSRFSIFELLAVTAIIGAFLAWRFGDAREHDAERRVLAQAPFLGPTWCYKGPEWLRRLWPMTDLLTWPRTEPESLMHVTEVTLRKPSGDPIDAFIGKSCNAITHLPLVRKVAITQNPPAITTGQVPFTSSPANALNAAEVNDVRGVDEVFEYSATVGPFEAQLLPRFSRLRRLEFYRCTIHPDGLIAVNRLDSLEELRFGLCEGLDESSLAALANAKCLRKLAICGMTVPPGAIDALKRMPHLEQLILDLDGEDFREVDYQRLVELPALKTLIIRDRRPPETLEKLRQRISNVLQY
jgi:hypothetical protein